MTTRVETSKPPRVRIADAFPELLSHLPPDQARVAGHYALATVETLRPGKWRPDPDLQPEPGGRPPSSASSSQRRSASTFAASDAAHPASPTQKNARATPWRAPQPARRPRRRLATE